LSSRRPQRHFEGRSPPAPTAKPAPGGRAGAAVGPGFSAGPIWFLAVDRCSGPAGRRGMQLIRSVSGVLLPRLRHVARGNGEDCKSFIPSCESAVPPLSSRFHQDRSSFWLKRKPSGWAFRTRRRPSRTPDSGPCAANAPGAVQRCAPFGPPGFGQARWPRPAGSLKLRFARCSDTVVVEAGPTQPATALGRTAIGVWPGQHANKIELGAAAPPWPGERKAENVQQNPGRVARTDTRYSRRRRCRQIVLGRSGPCSAAAKLSAGAK